MVSIKNLLDRERLIHSLKTAIACVIGVGLTKIVGFPADQWVVITIVVVMCAQIYVGSVLQKAYFRFLGTLIGCLFAASTLVLFGHTNLAIAITIGLSSFLFSYIATGQESMTYAGTLGAVTTAIILLGQHPTIYFAIERFLEIVIGILIATLVSQFILPIHARTHLRRAQAVTLEKLRDYYLAAMTTLRTQMKVTQYLDLDESIVKSLLKQRQLAKESKSEYLGQAFDAEHFFQTLYCEREILRSITFMHNTLTHISTTALLDSAPLHLFNEHVIQTFNELINVIRKKAAIQETISLPSITALKSALANVEEEERLYVDGFLCAAEILASRLSRLVALLPAPPKQA